MSRLRRPVPSSSRKSAQWSRDGNGRFQIVDLRPGTYTVTFTLTGFNTFKRDGVILTGAAASTVDAELRVGSLEETITVTGEAPIVDTHTLTKQQVLSADLVDALPSARNYVTLARMVSGTNASGNGANDVGGSLIQDVGGSLTVHGSRTTDQRVTANGINTMTLQAGGNIGGQTPDVGSAAEVSIDTTSLSADLPTGGVRINFIPRDGGNQFANSAFFTFSNESLQGNNFSDELKAAGLATPTKIVSNYDLNEAFGGPIKRDKVWFWFSTRYNTVKNEAGHLRERQRLQGERVALRADDRRRRSTRVSSSTTAFASRIRRIRSSRSPAPTRRTSGATVRTRSARRARLRPRATGDSRGCGRSTPRSPRRSPTDCCSRLSACTSTSAGATCTSASTAARSTTRQKRRCSRS